MQVSIKFLGKEEEIFGKEEEKFSLVKFFLFKMNWSRRRGKLPFDVLQKSSQTRRGGCSFHQEMLKRSDGYAAVCIETKLSYL